MEDFSKTDRISLFNNLTYDEVKKQIDERKFEGILLDKYNEFVEACNEIEEHADELKSVSCVLKDGEVSFELEYK